MAMRAADRFEVNVIGLTLSKNQHVHATDLAARYAKDGGKQRIEFRLQGWEVFDEKVDRIVSIGAFEHFGRPKYGEFFRKCRAILPRTA